MGAPDPAANAKRTHPDVEAYLKRQPLPQRALCLELRKLVKATAKDARETLYYGVPFFFVEGIWSCYVSPAKKHVTLGFTMGASIRDPSGRLVGTGRSPIKKVALALDEPVPDEARSWIEQAAALARSASIPKPDKRLRGAGSSSGTGPAGARRSKRSR